MSAGDPVRAPGGFRSRQFVAFLVTGGLAAGVNFASRILYNRWVSFSSAVFLAYLTGMVTAFLLARAVVFTTSRQSIRRSAAWFTVVNLAAVAQTWAVSMLLAGPGLPGVGPLAPGLAHAIGIVVPVFSSYLGHRRWSFPE